jgi:hypothetical protein
VELYRTIDQYRPTLLIDEADTIFVNGSNAELRGVLNAGLYRSNAFSYGASANTRSPSWLVFEENQQAIIIREMRKFLNESTK